MTVIDLTHTIKPGMPVYPGTEPPRIERANTIETDGFLEHKLTMYSHTGTHMDAPSHILKNGRTLDSYAADFFVGRASVIDVRDAEGRSITLESIRKYSQLLTEIDFLLLRTGWGERWGSEEYFSGYPVLNEDATKWLAGSFHLRGIGVDAISVDREDTTLFPVHGALLGKEMVILENIAHIDAVRDERFLFSCLPLKTEHADGSPVRAVAMLL